MMFHQLTHEQIHPDMTSLYLMISWAFDLRLGAATLYF